MKTIMAMYTGNEPQIGKSNQPFYFGEVPIVQSPIQATKIAIELSREPQLHKYVVLTSGNFFVTSQLEIGILPGTSFVIYALDDKVADPLIAGVDNYFVKEIDYETFSRIVVEASNDADKKACALGEAVEHAYLRFFGIDIAKLAPTDRIQITAHSQEYADQYDCGLSLELDRLLPALDYERVLAAAAMYQDIAKELKIEVYTMVIFLHTTDKAGEPCTVTLYSYAAKKETDESSNQATD
jgi:hypothetical protein